MADAEIELKMSAPNRIKNFFKYHWRGIYMILVPIVLAPLCIMQEGTKQWRCGYMILVMLAFWIPEVLPTYITGYFPIVIVPLCGIWDSDPICMSYFTDTFFFFFGAIMISSVFEFSKLHTRFALRLIGCLGAKPVKLHLCLMLITMLLSIPLTNIGSIAVMFPITRSILNELEDQGIIKTLQDAVDVQTDQPNPTKIVIAFYLGIAYAATVGGIIYPLGSDITRDFIDILKNDYPNAHRMSAFEYLLCSIPIALVIVLVTHIWMRLMYMGLLRSKSAAAQELKEAEQTAIAANVALKEKSTDLGRLNCHQIQVIILFFVWVVLMVTRRPGYANLQKQKDIEESMPTILVVIILFLLPANYYFLKYLICKRPDKEFVGKNSALLNWGAFQKYMQWGLLSLVGCGFAVAKAIEKSGLAINFNDALYEVKDMPQPMLQLAAIMAGNFLSTFCNNVGIYRVMAPLLNELAYNLNVEPHYLALPSSFAYNCAFLFPVSAVPNAVVHGLGNISTITMIIGGIVPTIVSILAIFSITQFWISVLG